MKKFLSLLVAGCGLIGAATSCSSDEPTATTHDGVTFNVQLPNSLNTRSFGDGLTATKLKYAIYEENGTVLLEQGDAEFVNLRTTVTFKLPKGKKYDIIFWAQSETDALSFDPATQSITVNYTNETEYTDLYDGFFHTEKSFSISGDENKTVYLTRPFAQLNIGTSDMDDASRYNLDYSKTKVSVDRVYTTMNLATGELSNMVTAEFPLAAYPAATERFPYPAEGETSPYNYLSMNYLLVDSTKDIHTVTLDVADPDFEQVTFDNVPMQRNYRTNIFGSLLTNPSIFDVIISPTFLDPDYNESR